MKIDRQLLLAYLSLFVLVLLSYGNTFPAHFFMDDHLIVELNPLVRNFDIGKILTTDYWGEAANSGLYRPLTIFSLYLNCLILGYSANAFQFINILLHGSVVLLLFPLLQRWKVAPPLAWLTAALFAVHPIHTEVINMVVGRSELLAALFLLLCLWTVPFSQKVTAPGLVASASFYFAALLSKEHAILLLALLPFLDYFALAPGKAAPAASPIGALKTIWRQRRALYLVLLGVTCLWLLWRTYAVVRVVPRALVEPAINPLHFMETIPRLLTAIKLQGLYLWKLAWPADLRAIYSGMNWMAPVESFPSLAGMVTIFTAAAALLLIVWGANRRFLPACGLLWTLLSFLPTANILLAVGVVFAERLAYWPSLWFCLTLASLVAFIPQRTLFVILSGVIILALMTTTLLRNRDFASEQRLWQHEVDRDPRNVVAWLALANSFADKVQAEAYFREKLALVPDLAEGQSVYAGVLFDLDRHDEAIAFALRAEADPRTDLLTNKFLLARAFQRQGNHVEALRWLEKSRPMYGEYGIYWEVRGMALEGLRRNVEAIDAYRRAAPYPVGSEVPRHLGNLLMGQDRYAEAEEVYRQGVALVEGAEGWNGLGVALALQGKVAESRDAFARAVALEPTSAKYQENYQRALGNASP
jgi:Tfp pilus assembly protein PilF